MIKHKILWLLIGVSLLFCNLGVAADKTPSHVFQQTEDIISEVKLLRQALNANDFPLEPEYQLLKQSIHVYSKGLEVLTKVSRIQSKLGMQAVEVGTIPLVRVTPSQVFGLTQRILTELRRIKSNLGVSTSIQPAAFVGNKQPSHVYRNMWRASYMLDAMVKAIKPSDVYGRGLYINNELDIIAKHLQVSLDGIKEPRRKERIRPKQVAERVIRNYYNLSRLQDKLGMPKARIQGISLERIRPSDVYDLAGMLIAELVLIKVHLGITTVAVPTSPVDGKQPADVLVQMELAGKKIAQIQRQMRSKGRFSQR